MDLLDRVLEKVPNIFDVLLVHSHRECADAHFALLFAPVSTIFHHFDENEELVRKEKARAAFLENFSSAVSARPNLQSEQWQLIEQSYQILNFSTGDLSFLF